MRVSLALEESNLTMDSSCLTVAPGGVIQAMRRLGTMGAEICTERSALSSPRQRMRTRKSPWRAGAEGRMAAGAALGRAALRLRPTRVPGRWGTAVKTSIRSGWGGGVGDTGLADGGIAHSLAASWAGASTTTAAERSGMRWGSDLSSLKTAVKVLMGLPRAEEATGLANSKWAGRARSG